MTRGLDVDDGELVVTNPLRPLWNGLAMLGLFTLFSILAVARVDLDKSVLRALLFLLILFVAMVAYLFLTADTVTMRTWEGRPIVLRQRRRRRTQIWLDELASVEREHIGRSETLRLTDSNGTSVAIPIRSWPQEQRLLEQIAEAAAATGAPGEVGTISEIPQPRWVRAAFPVLMYGGAVAWLSILIVLYTSR